MNTFVFSKTQCHQCDATYRKLDKQSVPYTVINAELDAEAFDFVVNTLGHRQMPVVLVCDGDWRDFVVTDETMSNFWSGFRPDRLDALAKQLEPANA